MGHQAVSSRGYVKEPRARAGSHAPYVCPSAALVAVPTSCSGHGVQLHVSVRRGGPGAMLPCMFCERAASLCVQRVSRGRGAGQSVLPGAVGWHAANAAVRSALAAMSRSQLWRPSSRHCGTVTLPCLCAHGVGQAVVPRPACPRHCRPVRGRRGPPAAHHGPQVGAAVGAQQRARRQWLRGLGGACGLAVPSDRQAGDAVPPQVHGALRRFRGPCVPRRQAVNPCEEVGRRQGFDGRCRRDRRHCGVGAAVGAPRRARRLWCCWRAGGTCSALCRRRMGVP